MMIEESNDTRDETNKKVSADSKYFSQPTEDAMKMAKFYSSISEEVVKSAKAYERPPENADNSLVFIEEYTLETERGQGRIYLTRYFILCY